MIHTKNTSTRKNLPECCRYRVEPPVRVRRELAVKHSRRSYQNTDRNEKHGQHQLRKASPQRFPDRLKAPIQAGQFHEQRHSRGLNNTADIVDLLGAILSRVRHSEEHKVAKDREKIDHIQQVLQPFQFDGTDEKPVINRK
jgi:hypothetical protein